MNVVTHSHRMSCSGSLPNREESRKCAGPSCCASSLAMPGGTQHRSGEGLDLHTCSDLVTYP